MSRKPKKFEDKTGMLNVSLKNRDIMYLAKDGEKPQQKAREIIEKHIKKEKGE